MITAIFVPIMLPQTREALAKFFKQAIPKVQVSPQPLPAATLEDARRIIPGNLQQIYRALNDGNPSAARGLIADQLLTNVNFLDAVCRPYSYRAHQIESIIERPIYLLEVPESAMRPLLIDGESPTYPDSAAAAGVSGTVVLNAEIGPNGLVEDVHLVSGHPLLASAGMDAVKRWRYKPYLQNGEPVRVETEITLPFTEKLVSVHK